MATETDPESATFHPGLLAFTIALGGAVIGGVGTYDYLGAHSTYNAAVAVGGLLALGIGGYALSGSQSVD